jgi:hypothetical protein
MTSLLGFVSAGSGLLAVGVLGNWSTRRRDSLGRPRAFPVWSVSLLTVLSVAALIPGAQRALEERKLARAATALVGHSVAVHCQSTAAALVDAGNELGFVPYDEDGVPLPRTTIKRDPCKALARYLGGAREHPSYDEVVAVHVLTHEAMHLRGETVEATAECQAVQRDRATAVLLGATPRQAEKLARTYWLTVYPEMPEDYSSAECKPGGALDENLSTAPWFR